MKEMIVALCFTVFCTTSLVEAKTLQLFNTAVLGYSTKDSIQLLNEKKAGDIEPITIMMDVKNGSYYAATICYPKELTFEEARASLNKIYKQYEKQSFATNPTMGLWRNENDKFGIQLSEDKECTQVMYIQFLPNEDILKMIYEIEGCMNR